MVRAYHVIFSAYGFWLPNDPRGSWSDFVRSWELLRHGQPTKVTTRASLAHEDHDHTRRKEAKKALRYPPVTFDGRQAQCVGKGFGNAVAELGYPVVACAILPEHVHMVVARCGRKIEAIVSHLKANATRQLKDASLHPLTLFANEGRIPSPWTRSFWKVFLNSDAQIEKAITNVEDNPTREGKPRQHWTFVRPWEPHSMSDLNV